MIPRCRYLPYGQQCDSAGGGGFMGHTCSQLTLHEIIKKHYHGGTVWPELKWAGYEPGKMAEVLKTFSSYLHIVYDRLFVESSTFGPAYVTAISDEGIRIEYFGIHSTANSRNDWDWVHPVEISKIGLIANSDSVDNQPK